MVPSRRIFTVMAASRIVMSINPYAVAFSGQYELDTQLEHGLAVAVG
jgi:hypothetical protein